MCHLSAIREEFQDGGDATVLIWDWQHGFAGHAPCDFLFIDIGCAAALG